jgi:amidase
VRQDAPVSISGEEAGRRPAVAATDDVAWLDATAQAELVASGKVSALELVDAAIARVEALDDTLNALPLRMFEEARERARGPLAGPFAGVPFVLKNLGASLRGEPFTAGLKVLARAGFRHPGPDAFLAARFRDAGLVTIGKGNVPEMAIRAVTEPESHGPTHNPWRLGHSCGGSSGGSAVAVASGMVPVAHATDGGGSIRIPASANGLVGLKPSRGRVSVGPGAGDVWRGLAYEFAVSRSVRDTAALLDVAAGPMPGDPWGAPSPKRPYREEVGADPGRLRIGLLDRSPAAWPELHPDCVAAVRDAAALLESLGHDVELTHPAVIDDVDYRPEFLTVVASHVRDELDGIAALVGRPLTPEDAEGWTWALGEHGRTIALADYLATGRVFNRYAREMGAWHDAGHDLLLSATLLTPPPPFGSMDFDPANPLGVFDVLHEFLPFTPIANMTGQPAISLPLWWNDDGLPVGVHLIAAYGREDVLLRVAAQAERVRPPFRFG